MTELPAHFEAGDPIAEGGTMATLESRSPRPALSPPWRFASRVIADFGGVGSEEGPRPSLGVQTRKPYTERATGKHADARLNG